MGKQENLAALGKFAEGVNTGKFDLFQEAVAADCVDHDPAPGQGPGPEGYRMFFSVIREAFPDLAVGLDTMVADEESIAFAYTMKGTHKGSADGDSAYREKGEYPGNADFEVPRWQDGGTVG